MKETIAELITPYCRDYTPLGYLALTLSHLLKTAGDYRDPGRWGSSGPTEFLSGYDGCVNCNGLPWHTNRMLGYSFERHTAKLNMRRAHLNNISDCILAALCSDQPACVRWRSEQGAGLDTLIKVRCREAHCGRGEDEAVKGFFALNKRRIKASLNSSHPRAKTLYGPQIFVSGDRVWCDVQVGYKQGGGGWDVAGFLLGSWRETRVSRGADLPPCPAHVWKPGKQTFAEFLSHATEQFAAL